VRLKIKHLAVPVVFLGKTMEKLVRDKIPEILVQHNRAHKTEILTDDQCYLSALHEKLIEEVQEFIEASSDADDQKTKEELADVLEVIDALFQLKKYDPKEIEAIRLEKKEKRGGFGKRVWLCL